MQTAEMTSEIPSSSAPTPPRRRAHLGRDLALIWIAVAVALAGVGVGVHALYRWVYSPSAFVEQYLGLLSQGRAADALALPGVAVDGTELDEAGLPANASGALLRPAALTSLTDVTRVSEEQVDGVTAVTVSYVAGGQPATSTFLVEPEGWIGIVPTWSFAQTPLAAVSVAVRGSQGFDVNGFQLDKRQVSPDGVEADPLEPVSLLVFSPGLYRIAVNTSLATTPGVDVLADAPLTNVPVTLQAKATPAFVEAVQKEVDAFLDECATQRVLQPTGCPFGYSINNRVIGEPTWTIRSYPVVRLESSGADWTMPGVGAVAHIDVEVQMLFDGSLRQVSEDVPFTLEALVSVLPDGTASIRMGTPEE